MVFLLWSFQGLLCEYFMSRASRPPGHSFTLLLTGRMNKWEETTCFSSAGESISQPAKGVSALTVSSRWTGCVTIPSWATATEGLKVATCSQSPPQSPSSGWTQIRFPSSHASCWQTSAQLVGRSFDKILNKGNKILNKEEATWRDGEGSGVLNEGRTSGRCWSSSDEFKCVFSTLSLNPNPTP